MIQSRTSEGWMIRWHLQRSAVVKSSTEDEHQGRGEAIRAARCSGLHDAAQRRLLRPPPPPERNTLRIHNRPVQTAPRLDHQFQKRDISRAHSRSSQHTMSTSRTPRLARIAAPATCSNRARLSDPDPRIAEVRFHHGRRRPYMR